MMSEKVDWQDSTEQEEKEDTRKQAGTNLHARTHTYHIQHIDKIATNRVICDLERYWGQAVLLFFSSE